LQGDGALIGHQAAGRIALEIAITKSMCSAGSKSTNAYTLMALCAAPEHKRESWDLAELNQPFLIAKDIAAVALAVS